MKTYHVNEIFYSIQGEGMRAGEPSLFVRFAGCNRDCTVESVGFACDTDAASGRPMSVEQIVHDLRRAVSGCRWVVLTGGEPGLQVDRELIDALHEAGFHLAIETNGTIPLPDGLDWITVSPKGGESELRQRVADEVKYVRAYGQPIPQTTVEARYRLISPAFEGDQLDERTLAWCVDLVKSNPGWRLTTQLHKLWGIR